MHRDLGLVQRFRLTGVGQPRGQVSIVLGRDRGGVDIGALAVGGGDGDRGGVTVVHRVRAHHRHTRPAAAGCVPAQPGPDRPRLQCLAAHVETGFGLRLGGDQGVEQPVAQHPELEVVEQTVNLVAVPRQQSQGVGRLGQWDVAHQLGQLTVEHHGGEVVPQRIADLAADGVDVVHQTLQ